MNKIYIKTDTRFVNLSIACTSFAECSTEFNDPLVDNNAHCLIDKECQSIHCCVGLDFKLTNLNVQISFVMDACNFAVSVGFEKHSFNFTLFDYNWGTIHEIPIGETLKTR